MPYNHYEVVEAVYSLFNLILNHKIKSLSDKTRDQIYILPVLFYPLRSLIF